MEAQGPPSVNADAKVSKPEKAVNDASAMARELSVDERALRDALCLHPDPFPLRMTPTGAGGIFRTST